jgi:outer membrane protein TolC
MNVRTIYVIAVTSLLLLNHNIVAQRQKLSLQEAVSLSLANNPELKASQLEIDKAGQQTSISRSLFLPAVTASGFVNHYFQRPVFFGFGDAATDGKISYGRFGGEDHGGVALTAIQPLFNPQASPALKYARVKEQEAKILFKKRQTQIAAQVKQTYLQLLVLQEQKKLQQQSYERNRRALLDSRSLLAQGKALRVDTLRAYTAMKNQEPELVKLTFALETGKLKLRSLIGIDSLQDIELTDVLEVAIPASLPQESEVFEIARVNNEEIQRLELLERSNGYHIRQATAAKLPVVSLVGQYQVQTQTNNLEYAHALYPASSYVGVQLSVPVFSGFSSNAKIQHAQYNKEQSSFRLKDAYEQLRVETKALVADCNESLARIYTTERIIETAQLTFDIVQYRYSRGVASRLELTDAELALTQAQFNYLKAVQDYLVAHVALSSLMGRID